MTRTPNLQGLAEVRENLLKLVALADVIGTECLVHYVQVHLEELGELRSEISYQEATIDSPPAETVIRARTESVNVRTPQRFEMPPVPSPSRKVPTSTSYNAERYVPIRVLWAKVIIRAAYDYALWKDSKDMRLRNFAKDAERWLFEPSDFELSFENICSSFDFPMEKIRQKTRSLTKQDVKKLEFRERHGRSDLLGESLSGNHR